MDILEKISGTDIYGEYKDQAEDKHQQVQTRLQQLEQDFNALPMMSNEAREASEDDLSDFNEQLIELDSEQAIVQQQLSQVQKTTQLQDNVDSLLEKQQRLNIQVEENQQNLERIETSEDIMVFHDDLATVDTKAEENQKTKATLDSYRSELEILQKQLQSTGAKEPSTVSSKSPGELKANLDELKLKVTALRSDLPKEKAIIQGFSQQLEQKKKDLKSSLNWLQDHDDDKKLLDDFPAIETLNTLRAELDDLSEKQKTYAKASNRSANALKQKTEKINSLNKKNSLLKDQLVKGEQALDEMSKGHSLDVLQEMYTDQQERVNNFVELNDLAIVNAKLTKKSFFGFLSIGKSEKIEEKELKQQADQLQMEIGREQNIIQTLELAVTNEILLNKMQVDRGHLVDGKHCPLCGSLNHPYSEHTPAATNSKQILSEQRKKVKVLMASAVSLKKQIASAKKAI